jgi:hypothetical protein
VRPILFIRPLAVDRRTSQHPVRSIRECVISFLQPSQTSVAANATAKIRTNAGRRHYRVVDGKMGPAPLPIPPTSGSCSKLERPCACAPGSLLFWQCNQQPSERAAAPTARSTPPSLQPRVGFARRDYSPSFCVSSYQTEMAITATLRFTGLPVR